ncbi:unnamed protein product, partial [Phaeothamnion confervicola]
MTDSDAWDDAAILRAFDTALSEHRLAKDDGDGKAEEDGEETQSRPVKITRARDEHEKSFAVADSRFEQLLAKGTEAGKARTAAVAPVTSRPSRSVAAKPKAEGVAGPWKPVDHDEEAAAAGATAPQSAQNGTWAAPMDPATVAAAAAGYDYAAYYAGHNAYDAAYPGAWGPNSLPYMPAPLPGYFPPHHYARDGAMPQPPPPPPHHGATRMQRRGRRWPAWRTTSSRTSCW